VRVRIGIHTGEAIQRDGDFYGRSVICAARTAANVEGGEILISSLVRELVDGREDIPLREAGEFELKGLDGRQRLFRVAWSPPTGRLGRSCSPKPFRASDSPAEAHACQTQAPFATRSSRASSIGSAG
jgi:class 3 adenylate cyclase